jgi:hypothetical protein
MTKNHKLALVFVALYAAAAGVCAQTAPTGNPVAQPGFYGGVALRDAGADAGGIHFGQLDSSWGRFASPMTDDTARRAMLFGGYRFANDVALEGSVSTADEYALRPMTDATHRGVGLSFGGGNDLAMRSWNADVYSSWYFRKSLSFYGRLGYAQNTAPPAYALGAAAPGDARGLRDGVNYGIGVRYDFNPALGLRLEYARFSRFAGEMVTGPLPDSDQVQFGMQFRF